MNNEQRLTNDEFWSFY